MELVVSIFYLQKALNYYEKPWGKKDLETKNEHEKGPFSVPEMLGFALQESTFKQSLEHGSIKYTNLA